MLFRQGGIVVELFDFMDDYLRMQKLDRIIVTL